MTETPNLVGSKQWMPAAAMVLAAGLGTRMRPLTDTRPKPLIKVNGKALIDYSLDLFADAGVSKAVVNVHYLADQIEAHVANRQEPQIIISDERDELLETGGGLLKARDALVEKQGDGQREKRPVFCTNTDAFLLSEAGEAAFPDPLTSPCGRLASHWDDARMDALLLLVPHAMASGISSKGDFDMRNDNSIEFRQGESAEYIFTGLQLISPRLFEGFAVEPFSTKLMWEKAIAKGRLFGLVHPGRWMHVGDPQGLDEAEAYFRKTTSQSD